VTHAALEITRADVSRKDTLLEQLSHGTTEEDTARLMMHEMNNRLYTELLKQNEFLTAER